jgi:hypothetical protein
MDGSNCVERVKRVKQEQPAKVTQRQACAAAHKSGKTRNVKPPTSNPTLAFDLTTPKPQVPKPPNPQALTLEAPPNPPTSRSSRGKLASSQLRMGWVGLLPLRRLARGGGRGG